MANTKTVARTSSPRTHLRARYDVEGNSVLAASRIIFDQNQSGRTPAEGEEDEERIMRRETPEDEAGESGSCAVEEDDGA